jgi:hypothetical protein
MVKYTDERVMVESKEKHSNIDQEEVLQPIKFNSNKVAKIILLKKIAPVVLSFVLGTGYVIYRFFGLSGELNGLKDEIKVIDTNIQREKKTTKFYQAENQTLKYELKQLRDSSINMDLVNMLANKFASLLKLRKIIPEYTLTTTRSMDYANVVHLHIKLEQVHELLDNETVEDIFTLIFSGIFYVKSIEIKDDIIMYEIYKKVES